MARRLIVHAPNVHQGGGATLLSAILANLPDCGCDLILDERLSLVAPLRPDVRIQRVAPSLPQRLHAERRLASLADAGSEVLCFSGFPPLFRCAARVSVFVQNRNVIGRTDLSAYPWRQRLRIELERLWFRSCARHADEFLVQTETMRDLLREVVGPRARIRVRPFLPDAPPVSPFVMSESEPQSGAAARLSPPPCEGGGRGEFSDDSTFSVIPLHRASADFDFCYIATGEPHKNHRNLIAAWVQLAKNGRFPTLCLTLSPGDFPKLCLWIDSQIRKHGPRIRNAGYVSRADVEGLYRRSRRLIYPSHYESFGLPLLEAMRHGLPIVAAERDYVRDVVCPEHTFDPESPRSIARAVERALGITDTANRISTPQEFLSELLAA